MGQVAFALLMMGVGVVIGLAAGTEQTITGEDVAVARTACESNADLAGIVVSSRTIKVRCGNGAEFTLKKGGE